MAKRKTKKKNTRRSARPSSGGASAAADDLASGIDPEAKAAILVRLRRAKGQAAGVENMIENDRDCADIMTQIIATRASMLAVAKTLLKEHMLRAHHLAKNNGEIAMDDMYQELVDLLTRMAR